MVTVRPPLGHTMTMLRPARRVFAFYDGRLEYRAYSDAPNWVDDGALELGIASYAVVDGNQAIVYDTHVSIPHALKIRARLDQMGVTDITVVLSHWHLDHIAGNEVFADCEIIAHEATAGEMARRRERIEAGTEEGAPPIRPLVMPTTTFADEMRLTVGETVVLVRHAPIHSRDGTVLFLPETGCLLAGDTLEDTCTYVAEPDGLERDLPELARMAAWQPTLILPNHGDPVTIARGGYRASLIAATERYVRRLLSCPYDPVLAAQDLKTFVGPELAEGWLVYYGPYEHVHRANVAAVLDVAARMSN